MACYAYKKKFRDPEYRKGGTLALGDKQEVETVKLIYRLYLETDTSGRAIALELNRRGIPSPNGGKWNHGSVRNILVRHAYKGEATWGRLCGSFKTVSGGEVIDSPGARSLKDEADWVIVKCPAIVSVKDWEAVQKKLTSRVTRKTPYVGGGEFLLSGLLHCANCGGPMRGSKRANSTVTSYACGWHNDFKECSHNAIREDLLLAYLVAAIREDLLSAENLDRLRASIERGLGKKSNGTADATKHLRKRLRRLDRDIRAAVEEMTRTPDDLHGLVVERIRGLREDRDQAAAQLEEVEATRTGG